MQWQLWQLEGKGRLTPAQRGFFCAPKLAGGGGIVLLVKTQLPFSELTQVKFFLKLVQNANRYTLFCFHDNNV